MIKLKKFFSSIKPNLIDIIQNYTPITETQRKTAVF
jgi:hypothetical protein